MDDITVLKGFVLVDVTVLDKGSDIVGYVCTTYSTATRPPGPLALNRVPERLGTGIPKSVVLGHTRRGRENGSRWCPGATDLTDTRTSKQTEASTSVS